LPPYITSMRVTTWAEYGLIVSVNLARRAGQGPVAARELAEQERLPHDYVEQILLRLRRAGLVDSVRGAKGGYHLAREPHVITVKDVIEASEHVTFEVNCDLHPVDPSDVVRRLRAASGPSGECWSNGSTICWPASRSRTSRTMSPSCTTSPGRWPGTSPAIPTVFFT